MARSAKHGAQFRSFMMVAFFGGLAVFLIFVLSLRSKSDVTQGLESFAAAVQPVNLGVLSDSTSDEYRANDNRGGTYGPTTLNWAELLVKYRNFNMGAWGDRAEPRRGGYEYNWSKTGAVVADLNSTGAATGLANQVRAGLINVVVVQIGANDFSIYSNRGKREGYDICNGSFTAAQIQQKNAIFIAELTKTFDTLRAAGSVPVVVASVPDTTLSPTHARQCSQAQKLKDAIASLNGQIRTLTTQRGYVFYDLNLLAQSLVTGIDAQGKLTIGGVKIDFLNNSNAPTSVVLADGIHPGTVYSGILANEILKPINQATGNSVPLFTDDELLIAAGIKQAPSSPTVTMQPTQQPTMRPTASPTLTPRPTATVTPRPTGMPTVMPTVRPTSSPVATLPPTTTGSKTVKIVNRPNSSREATFVFDGIVENGSVVEFSKPRFTSTGSWRTLSTFGVNKSQVLYTSQPGASVTFTTNASSLTLQTASYTIMGSFEVYVDGVSVLKQNASGRQARFINIPLW